MVMCILSATAITAKELHLNAWQIRYSFVAGAHGLYLAYVRGPDAVYVFVESSQFPHHTVGHDRGLGERTRGHGGEEKTACDRSAFISSAPAMSVSEPTSKDYLSNPGSEHYFDRL